MLARLARARLLRAVAPASALAQRSLVAGRVGRRQLAVATAARFSVASPSQAPPVLAEAASAAPSSADAAAAEAQESAPMDLSEVGAESSKVLTIADVLSTRESEVLAAAGSAGLGWFEEWESVSGSETVHDAVALMVERNIGSLIVTEENAGVVGIVTERDVLTKMSPRSVLTEEKLVRDIMSSHIMCIHPSTTVIDALATMTKENIRHLAVLHGELSTVVKKGSVPEEAMRCVLSITDILKAYSRFEAQKKAPKVESADAAASATVEAAATTEGAAESAEEAPPTTAATLLKKKAKHVKLILNTRPEDNISVADAVDEMRKHNFGAVLVVDKEQRVQGIFTERDYLLKVLFEHKDPTQVRLTEVASTVRTYLQIEDPLEKCWNLAVTEDCRHFPVIGVMRKDREKELAGILSIKDIVREISKGHETSTGFRLMDFFKSKRDSLKQEPKPEQPKPEQAVAAAVAAAAVEATASTPSAPAEDSTTSTEAKSDVASSSSSEVTEAVEKKD